VAPGATLRLAATDAISASAVRVGGTFEGAAAVSGLDSLTIPCENGIPVASVQSIPFAFADGTVSVTLDGFDAKTFSRAGFDSMTIFEAPSISGSVTFALTNETNRRYPARLTVSGGKLILFVRRPGFVMDFR